LIRFVSGKVAKCGFLIQEMDMKNAIKLVSLGALLASIVFASAGYASSGVVYVPVAPPPGY